ncbi:tyrosinase family oxidase copper chaperone [Streptomyces lasalocidi]
MWAEWRWARDSGRKRRPGRAGTSRREVARGLLASAAALALAPVVAASRPTSPVRAFDGTSFDEVYRGRRIQGVLVLSRGERDGRGRVADRHRRAPAASDAAGGRQLAEHGRPLHVVPHAAGGDPGGRGRDGPRPAAARGRGAGPDGIRTRAHGRHGGHRGHGRHRRDGGRGVHRGRRGTARRTRVRTSRRSARTSGAGS